MQVIPRRSPHRLRALATVITALTAVAGAAFTVHTEARASAVAAAAVPVSVAAVVQSEISTRDGFSGRLRLQAVYGDRASLTLERLHPCDVCATVTIPA